MSWDYHLAADAIVDLRRLDPEVQEAVLDELDDLCESADEEKWVGTLPRSVYPVINGVMHPLKLELNANPSHALLTVMGIDPH